MTPSLPPLQFDTAPTAADRAQVRRIVLSTGVFSPVEIDCAVELIDDRLAKGGESDYRFVFARQGEATLGYTCHGPIPLTAGSFDLYWIAVEKAQHGLGVGRQLLARTEAEIAAAGGRLVFIETSHRDAYAATRGFYLRCGYTQAAVLADFYAPGDDKVIYVKRLSGAGA